MYDGDVEDQLPPSSCLYVRVVGERDGRRVGGYCPPLWEEVEALIRTPAKSLCINRAERGKTLLPRAHLRSR